MLQILGFFRKKWICCSSLKLLTLFAAPERSLMSNNAVPPQLLKGMDEALYYWKDGHAVVVEGAKVVNDAKANEIRRKAERNPFHPCSSIPVKKTIKKKTPSNVVKELLAKEEEEEEGTPSQRNRANGFSFPQPPPSLKEAITPTLAAGR